MFRCSSMLAAQLLIAASFPSLAGNSAIAAEAFSEDPFDVTDMSFLIPPSERSIRVAATNGNGPPILSKRLFDKFQDFITVGHPGIEDPYGKLIVTGFRFDPCGPAYPADWDIKKCVLPNIRLITQIYDKGGVATAALHMVFTLGVKLDQNLADMKSGIGFDPEIRSKALHELRQMKVRNSASGILTKGAPLGVHPAFFEENSKSARTREFESEFEQFVRALATETSYFTTAVMFTAYPSASANDAELEGKERWIWQKANIVRKNPSGQLEFVFGGIPGFDPNLKQQTLTADLERRSGVVISPASTIENGGVPNSLISSILRESSDIDWGQLQAAVNVADMIENPDRVLVQNDDCVSCHVASTVRSYALKDGRLTWVRRPNVYRFDAKAAALTDFLAFDDASWLRADGYRVMSFGFFKGRPSISQRIVNETLQAAHLLNCNSAEVSNCTSRRASGSPTENGQPPSPMPH